MKNAHVSDQLPAYVLESLSSDERRDTSLHLADCASCRQELAEYKDAMTLLGTAIPLKQPHPSLRSRVIHRVLEDNRRLDTYSRKKSPFSGYITQISGVFNKPFGLAILGMMVLLLLVLSINTFIMNSQITALKAALPSKEIRIVQVTGTEHAPTTIGYLMLIKNESSGSFAIHDAPVLDAEHQYQVWLIKDGKRTSGGVFSVTPKGYGTLTIELDQPLESFQSIGITIEPLGGSPGPTGNKILGGSI